MNEEYWTNNNFLEYYRKYKTAIRGVWPEAMMLMQPSPFEIPPRIKGTEDEDPNMIFASHFYDGITLITKKWNKIWNIDVLGFLRGRYSNPAFAIKIGETAIRNCFKDQLNEIRLEGIEYMGVHPCIYTEIGIPYDMDDKYAYKTGDYRSQAAAIDANCYAIEGSKVAGFTWWVYSANNSHFWGDNWNGEDLSIYCAEDKPLPPSSYTGKQFLDPSSPSYSESQSESNAPVTPRSLQQMLSVDDMKSSPHSPPMQTSDTPGYRGAEAYIRPTPIATHESIQTFGFDLKTCTFTLTLTAATPTPQDHPTEVFLPDFHFPQAQTVVEVSGGKWTISVDEVIEGAPQQILRWWHGEGEQRIKVKGLKRRRGTLQVKEEEEGYLDAYWEMGRNCRVM